MFDEFRSLDVDASCESLEITIFLEAVEFTQAHFDFIYPPHLNCRECMGSVLHVLMLGAGFGRCYSYTALLSCHRH